MEVGSDSSDVVEFAQWLFFTVQTVISYARVDTHRIDREKLWMKFHQVRSNDKFRRKWETFLSKLCLPADPVFYQQLSLIAFESRVASSVQICAAAHAMEPKDLNFEEMNALRYVGGYILRSISKQHEIKCLTKATENTDPENNPSEEWVCAVDRGGLIHITDSFCDTLCSAELTIRTELNASNNTFDQGRLHEAVLDNSDVLFNWCLASVDIEEQDASTLFEAVISKFITIRGFSFSKSIVELYKQQHKKSTQKSKPLRRKVSQIETIGTKDA